MSTIQIGNYSISMLDAATKVATNVSEVFESIEEQVSKELTWVFNNFEALDADVLRELFDVLYSNYRDNWDFVEAQHCYYNAIGEIQDEFAC